MARPQKLVPEDNQPGHHPSEEQDKPDPDAFVAKFNAAARGDDDDRSEDDDGDGTGHDTGDGAIVREISATVREIHADRPDLRPRSSPHLVTLPLRTTLVAVRIGATATAAAAETVAAGARHVARLAGAR